MDVRDATHWCVVGKVIGNSTHLVRLHFSRCVNFWAGNVAMHVDCTRHHDATRNVFANDRSRVIVGRRFRDPAVTDPDVADFPVNFVGRVVDGTASKQQIAQFEFLP